MQSIVTKYIPATNTKPSRIKATCWRGSVTLSFNHELSVTGNHEAAIKYMADELTRIDAYPLQKWEVVAIGSNPNQDGFTGIAKTVEVK